MSINDFILMQPPERQQLFQEIHGIIIETDTTVHAAVQQMMGKEMIVYNAPGTFKYGLAGLKNYMSLHVMPIYAAPGLYAKYKALLPKANFQKGCINFKNASEMPSEVIKQLMTDCAKIDLKKIKEAYLKSKKT